jgi:hypothetical protein
MGGPIHRILDGRKPVIGLWCKISLESWHHPNHHYQLARTAHVFFTHAHIPSCPRDHAAAAPPRRPPGPHRPTITKFRYRQPDELSTRAASAVTGHSQLDSLTTLPVHRLQHSACGTARVAQRGFR